MMDESFDFETDGSEPNQPASKLRPAPRQASHTAEDTASPGRDVHLVDYLKVLYKRRWTALAAFLIVVGSVTVYTFTVTPIFEAKSRLLIESDDRNVVAFKQVVEEEQLKADFYPTQYNILQSRALARKTIDALGLWEEPHLLRDAASASSWLNSFAFWRKHVQNEPAENDIPSADETAAQSRVIDAFLRNLTISPIRMSRLVDIKYRLPDAQLATNVANALAKSYIEQNLEYKFMASKEATDWLGERLKEQRQEVEKAEAALQSYREQNDAISLEDRENIVVQKLTDLNAAVTRAKTERIEKEALYNQLRESQGNLQSLDTFPAILGNAFIQQQKSQLADLQRQEAALSEKLADKHPDLIKIRSAMQISQTKLDAEIGKVVQSVRSEYQTALAQERSLSGALAQQKSEALSMNRKAIDYSVLEREVQSTQQIYDSLMQRAKETGVAGELRTSNVRVIDRAQRPRSPVVPQRTRNVVLALFGGLVFACGLVFFFEYLDSRIKTPDEIKRYLGLPYLGFLPVVHLKELQGGPVLLSKGVPASFAEAFRGIRTNVIFSTAQQGGQALVVTSTGPGEGKSLVASNLATSLAQAGQRILLIDADMRKPTAHTIFGMAQEPGLSNLLVGNSKASDTVRKSTQPGLWLMPAGHIPPNPAELLGSQRFVDLTTSLKGHFDWVIIDSPPVMAVTDASLIAHHANGLVFVVGAEMTSRHAALRSLEQLEKAQAKIVGAVLNRVDIDRNPYYYSQYYRREYAEYYTKTA